MHQCLRAGEGTRRLRRVVLTASGGPFRGRDAADLAAVTVEQALAHPTWSMGPKITVDSSTLMNKGLEVIEAHELFDVDYDDIDVVVHPQSIVHSMAEFTDGTTIAQLSMPDMRLPIGYALAYPDRIGTPFGAHGLDRAARRSPSSRPTARPSAASTWPTRPVVPGRPHRRGCPPPTRSRSTRSSTGASAGPASPRWSTRRWTAGTAPRPTRSTPCSPPTRVGRVAASRLLATGRFDLVRPTVAAGA